MNLAHSIRVRGALAVLACVLAFGLASDALATPMPIMTAPGSSSFSNDPFVIGFEFTVNHDSEYATALGWWDEDGDGLTTDHEVGLWSNDGTLLGSVIVPAGDSGVLIGEYRYVALDTAVFLAVGQSYVIAGKTTAAESYFRFDDPTTTGIMTPNYNVEFGRYLESVPMVFPTEALYSQMWTNANLLAGSDPLAGTGPPVPEPGTALLVGVGLAVLARGRRATSAVRAE